MADIAHPIPTLRFQTTRARLARAGGIFRAALKSPTMVGGSIVIILLLLMAAFAPLIIEPNVPDAYQMPRDYSAVNAPPGTPGHLLGTTPTGGDVLYGVVWGSRMSVRLSVIVVTVVVLVGVTVGSIAGFIHIDDIVLAVSDQHQFAIDVI